MRLIVPALVLVLASAGCLGGASGTLAVLVSDEPNDIGDFTSLVVKVDHITLKTTGSDDPNATEEEGDTHLDGAGASESFALTTLQGSNETTLFRGDVPVGTYKRMDIFVSEAKGTLAADGSVVDVAVPSGRLFLKQTFTVEEGATTEFLFDITVHRLGNGEYQLKPNATESGVKDGGAAADGKGKA